MNPSRRATVPDRAESRRDVDQTRAALRRFVMPEPLPDSGSGHTLRAGEPPVQSVASSQESAGAMRIVGAAIGAWWAQNPLSVLPKLARPLVSEQVRKHPWPAVGLAATAGAAIVLLRPWRHLPAANLAGALLRTTSVSSVAAAALAALQASLSDESDAAPD